MHLLGSCFTTLEEAVQGADLVQENGPETVDFKQAMYADLKMIGAVGDIAEESMFPATPPKPRFNRK